MNSATLKTMFSSEDMSWETPQDFYNKLNEEFDFDLDPCATSSTAKCAKYFTEDDDGLKQSWSGHTVFCNPPYGREIKNWIKKAYEESTYPGTTVVMLIPSRTDTIYWHRYVMRAKEIRFVKGRLKFGKSTTPAPFPSAVVIFKADKIPEIKTMEA